ncbi:MAG: T9SS type A sorting domain-containing protein [Bacteroidetes bacterium]|nr:T9SS type A sorting domain-containing protein [Bacteroidota bacterium]
MKRIFYNLFFAGLALGFYSLPANAQISEWNQQSSGIANNLNSIFFIDNQHGWAVGDAGKIVSSANGGATWSEQTSGVAVTLNSVFFVSAQKGWIAGNSGNILFTEDGGTTWTPQTSGTVQHLRATCFVNDSSGWVAGDAGTVRYTTNSGATWSTQTITIQPVTNGLCFVSDSIGWGACNSGKVTHTVNAGTSWTVQTTGTAFNLMSVSFPDANNGWAVGLSGTIIHTVNGGTTWAAQTSGVGASIGLTGVFFTDSLNGWVPGTNGTIRHTYNGGTTWIDQSLTAVTTSLRGVYFKTQYNGWIAGYSGVILSMKTHEEICMVTVDSASGKNLIMWEKVEGQGTAYYNIYKLAGAVYDSIGFSPFDSLSVFIDYLSAPEVHADRYKISTVDSSGVESPLSPYHQTILLQINQGVPITTFNLDWDDYVDESGAFAPGWYYVLKGTDGLNFTLFDSISGGITAYSDNNIFTTTYYKISVTKPYGCYPSQTAKGSVPSGPYSQSLSNMDDTYGLSSFGDNQGGELSVFVFPNPLTESSTLNVSGLTGENVVLSLTDITGRMISASNHKVNGQNDAISLFTVCGNLPGGIYLLRVADSRSVSTVKLFVK